MSQGKQRTNWYSVSVASVRRFFTLATLVAVLLFAFYSWMRWDVLSLESRADDSSAGADAR